MGANDEGALSSCLVWDMSARGDAQGTNRVAVEKNWLMSSSEKGGCRARTLDIKRLLLESSVDADLRWLQEETRPWGATPQR